MIMTITYNTDKKFMSITYTGEAYYMRELTINQNLSIDCHNVTGEEIEQAYNIFKLLSK